MRKKKKTIKKKKKKKKNFFKKKNWSNPFPKKKFTGWEKKYELFKKKKKFYFVLGLQ